MKSSGNQFTYANVRLIAVAALAVTLTFASASGFAAVKDKDVHEDRVEVRINDMHARLKITPAQEDQWGKVAEVMRADAKELDTLTQARKDHAKDRNAVDDLKSYSEITDAHAEGVKQLIPVFSDLYASMSAAQKQTADTLFERGDRKHGGKAKASTGK